MKCLTLLGVLLFASCSDDDPADSSADAGRSIDAGLGVTVDASRPDASLDAARALATCNRAGCSRLGGSCQTGADCCATSNPRFSSLVCIASTCNVLAFGDPPEFALPLCLADGGSP